MSIRIRYLISHKLWCLYIYKRIMTSTYKLLTIIVKYSRQYNKYSNFFYCCFLSYDVTCPDVHFHMVFMALLSLAGMCHKVNDGHFTRGTWPFSELNHMIKHGCDYVTITGHMFPDDTNNTIFTQDKLKLYNKLVISNIFV